MAITIEQSSSLNSNAYNRNEYVLSSNFSAFPKFKYNFNILYDLATITAIAPYQLNGLVYTKLTISDNLFAKGDKVFVTGNENYNVLEINTAGSFVVIDAAPDDLDINLGTTGLSKTISYSVEKEPKTELGILDIRNTLRAFCTQELIDTPNLYWSDNILFRYNMVFGEQYDFIHSFTDNAFNTGSTAFINPSLSASYTASLPFQVGDQIVVQQDLYEWTYIDNQFFSGSLAFTGSTAVPFSIGSQVYVTGQDTYNTYNGYTTVIAGTTGSRLVTDKSFIGSTPVEGGIIYGTPKPEYNTVATITNIYFQSGLGVVIVTDIPWAGSSPTIPGKMKFSDGRLVKNWAAPTTKRLASTGKFDKLQEQTFNSENYHLNDQVAGTKFISSIISFNPANYKHRVEKSTKGWMLVKPALHTNGTENTSSLSVRYKFYNDSNALLGTGSFNYSSSIRFTQDKATSETGYYGIYVPVGLNQLSSSATFTSSLSSYINSVDYYQLEVTNSLCTTRPVKFEINEDCGGGYELYHLLFKDSMGSWVPVPFKYKSLNSTESTTGTYYAKEGKLNAGTKKMDYTSYDRGKTNIYKRYTDKIKLTSGWLDEAENLIIKDLLTSPDVVVQDPQNNLRAVQILNTEVDLQKKENVQIFNYSFDIAMSIDELRF
jgi:hypothetical protein